jgi:DNA polymerase elongation subunit (family B)
MSVEINLFQELDKIFSRTDNICSNTDNILPCKNEIDNLIESVKEDKSKVVKKLIEYLKIFENTFDTTQLAYKVASNGLYGFFGERNSRFFVLAIAEGITQTGQEESTTVINRLLQFDYFVIYSDTDSCFINVGKDINKEYIYQKLLEKFKEELKEKYNVENIEDLKELEKREPEKFEDYYIETVIEFILNEYVPVINDISNDILNQLAYNQGENNPQYEKTHFYHFKQEIIARSGIFVPKSSGQGEAKKRYTLYVIDKEKVRKDDIECAGCPLKQSAFPEFVKQKYLEFANLLLKERFRKYRNFSKEEFEKILIEFIFNYKNELIEYCKTWNIEYIAQYKQLTKPFNEYKTKDSFVKFAEYWNNELYKLIKLPQVQLNTRYISLPIKPKKIVRIPEILSNKLTEDEKLFMKKLYQFIKTNNINEVILVDENDEKLLEIYKTLFDINSDKYIENYLINIYKPIFTILNIPIEKVLKGITISINDLF